MLAEGWFSERDGCWKQERDALLHLKAISSKVKSQYNYWLNTWVDGTDCCQWENIECNTRRRVSKVNLQRMRDDRLENWYLNLSDFQAFDDIKSLDLTDNSIAGFVENKGICALSKLEMLDLSFNYNISGFDVPQGTNICLANLKILLLKELKIDGTLVAGEFGDLEKLEHLELDGYFNIGNEFFKSIGALTSLKVLSLSSCGIKGSLPFAGPIPNCLGKFPSETQERQPFFSNEIDLEDTENVFPFDYSVELRVTFTTKWRSYTYEGSIIRYMSGIDLSHNNLNGNIPSELGNLMHIRALNLSHNHLSGQIPMTFSNLKQVESLDLSFNNLSGKIPPQLIELTSLKVFSLAYNNLSGSTPEQKGQFMTFDGSSYEGNSFLCGPPLDKSCTPYGIFPNAFDVEAVNNGGIVDMEFFYIGFVVSYTLILFEMAAVLYIEPQLRGAWFYFIESIISYCHYYFSEWFPIQHM
ncbi:hypothetical protein L6164_033373 [Bauhinia variegata]|uniref:Uncharacterized protein n=1 Tax=Bauhinia variegata TaxID=167791 RepID=A0ACB9KSE4_BAUVA|nr:hypothetical protein L6164_033373 [Bauhinia variegata]